jgi:hypothetical protein
MTEPPKGGRGEAVQLYDLVRETLMDVARAHEEGTWSPRPIEAFSSGDETLDYQMGYFLPGDVLSLTGRRDELLRAALRLCLNAASVTPTTRRVLLVCPNHALSWIGAELLCEKAEASAADLRTGRLDDASRERLYEGAAELSQLPLFVDDVSASPAALDARLRRLERGPFRGAELSKLVVLLGAQAAWASGGSGTSLGLALRRLARKRRAAIVWAEEDESGGLPRIPTGLLTGELRLWGDPEDHPRVFVEWHRRAAS